MTSRRPYIGPSEAQTNAEALARRGSPYTAASDASFRVNWGNQHREPERLRDALRAVRKAYADEVPEKLHDSAIGEDGTPRMNARAVGYIFGDPRSDDAGRDPETGQRDLVGYHFTPFRAELARMEHGSERERFYGLLVTKVTVGGMEPEAAALAAGVRPQCIAKGEVFMALRAFLRGMSAVRVHVAVREEA